MITSDKYKFRSDRLEIHIAEITQLFYSGRIREQTDVEISDLKDDVKIFTF